MAAERTLAAGVLCAVLLAGCATPSSNQCPDDPRRCQDYVAQLIGITGGVQGGAGLGKDQVYANASADLDVGIAHVGNATGNATVNGTIDVTTIEHVTWLSPKHREFNVSTATPSVVEAFVFRTDSEVGPTFELPYTVTANGVSRTFAVLVKVESPSTATGFAGVTYLGGGLLAALVIVAAVAGYFAGRRMKR